MSPSNTGRKCISDFGSSYRIAVMWRGDRRIEWLEKSDYRDPLKAAVRLRNRIMRELGAPVTERWVRSSGVFNQRIGTSRRVARRPWFRV